LVLSHSVKDNMQIALFGQTKKGFLIDNKKTVQFTNDSVRELDIKAASINMPINRLSGGNQQKVVIAKWLKNDPKVLLMDEPTAGIDVGAKSEIIKIIKAYAEKNNSVLVISSEISELMAMCDRIIVLYNGRIVRELMRDEIENEEVIQHAIQG